MKKTLQFLAILFGTTCVATPFLGLAGLNSAFAFLTSETAFWLYAVVGLMLVGFNDYTPRRLLYVHSARSVRTRARYIHV